MRIAVDAIPLSLRTGGHIKRYIANIVDAVGSGGIVDDAGFIVYATSAAAKAFPGASTHPPQGFLGGSPRLWERFKLADAAYADKADLLFCPAGAIPPWNLLPVAVTVPDAAAFAPLHAEAPPWLRVLSKRLPFALARAQRIFVPSEEAKRAVLKWNAALPDAPASGKSLLARTLERFRPPADGRYRVPSLGERIAVIPWTAEDAFRRRLPRADLEAFAKAYVGGEYVLAPCLEGYAWNLPLMLQAWFSAVAKHRLNHRFVALVERPDRQFDRFIAFAKSLGVADRVQVAATDSLDAWVLFHHGASLTLLPEDVPGCGLSLSRALAAGTPVAAGGRSDTNRDQPGENILWVSDLTVKSWYTAVSELLTKSNHESAMAAVTTTWKDHAAAIASACMVDPQKGDG